MSDNIEYSKKDKPLDLLDWVWKDEVTMYCKECNAKLFSFYGEKDISRTCPKKIDGVCCYER